MVLVKTVVTSFHNFYVQNKKIPSGIQVVKATPVGLFVTSPLAAPTARPTENASPASSSLETRLSANVIEDSLNFSSKIVDSSLEQKNPR